MNLWMAPLSGALLLLMACGTLLPPAAPSGRAWGVPYTLAYIPAGSLSPLYGQTIGHQVQIDERARGNLFVLAHELTHVYDWVHGLPVRWIGQPCAVQPASHCGLSGVEAHADAVAIAVMRAGCNAGDLGIPDVTPSGCILPDPLWVR